MNQSKYISLFINTININYGQIINNFIFENKITSIIQKKNNNLYTIHFTNNNNYNNKYNFLNDINNIINNNTTQLFIIIPYTEFLNMIELFNNSDNLLVNYNDLYYILQIEPYLIFNTHNYNISKLKDKFSKIINT